MQKQFFMLMFVLLLGNMSGWGRTELCNSGISYHIDATLDPETAMITGSQQVVWTNASDRSVQDIYFHADLNVFRNNTTAYYRASRNQLAADAWRLDAAQQEEKNWGYIKIKSVRLNDRLLEPVFDHDFTVFKVVLPAEIGPGRTVTLDMEFDAKLPFDGPGLGFKDRDFVAARWYPRMGVWQNGTWSCEPFYLHSGLFGHLADYKVNLTVPTGYQIAATTVSSDSIVKGDSKIVTFYQNCVTDFCWAASPFWEHSVREFTHNDLPPVHVHIYQTGKRKADVQSLFDAASEALIHFGLWYAPFPYDQLTIIDGILTSAGTHVLPLVVLTGEEGFLTSRQLPTQYQVVRQTARQFWSVMMSGKQDRWFAAGLSEYAAARCMNAVYGARYYSTALLQRDNFEIPVVYKNSRIFQWSFNQHVWDYRGQISDLPLSASLVSDNPIDLDANFSEKSALAFWTLEATLGEEVFGKAIRTFAEKYQFKNPSPADFQDIVNGLTDQNTDWFFLRLRQGRGYVDYAVKDILSQEKQRDVGFFKENDGLTYLSPTTETDGEIETFESIVTLGCDGDIGIPVDIRITLDNGDEIVEKWDGSGQFKQIRLFNESMVSLVEIDPQNRIYLDVFRNNNKMYFRANPVPALKWTTRWLFWLQHFFEIVGFFS